MSKRLELLERLSELRAELAVCERDIERMFGGCWGWLGELEVYVRDEGVGGWVRRYLRVCEEIEELRRELSFRCV